LLLFVVVLVVVLLAALLFWVGFARMLFSWSETGGEWGC